MRICGTVNVGTTTPATNVLHLNFYPLKAIVILDICYMGLNTNFDVDTGFYELFVAVTQYLRKETSRRKDLFWLTLLEVLVHG